MKKVVPLLMAVLFIGLGVWGASKLVWASSQIGELTEMVRDAEARADEAEDRQERSDQTTEENMDDIRAILENIKKVQGDLLLNGDKNGGGCEVVLPAGFCFNFN